MWLSSGEMLWPFWPLFFCVEHDIEIGIYLSLQVVPLKYFVNMVHFLSSLEIR